jgi:hypothetical protein
MGVDDSDESDGEHVSEEEEAEAEEARTTQTRHTQDRRSKPTSIAGGNSKALMRQGARVEVLAVEPGLRGCWFTASVVTAVANKVIHEPPPPPGTHRTPLKVSAFAPTRVQRCKSCGLCRVWHGAAETGA